MKDFNYEKFLATELPDESEIISGWIDHESDPVVSVICTTYNQAAYIGDALRSFLLQKTYFPFEIVVHDDASDDGTVEVIRAYHEKFPRIIFPIYQKENQYSQGKKVSLIAALHSRGRYLALCEGDDFWVDENKLVRQYETLEMHEDVDLSFHGSWQLKGHRVKAVRPLSRKSSFVAFREVVRGGGGYIATPSIMVRRRVFDNMPAWFEEAPVGDYFIQMLGARRGAIYLPQKMAAYRVMAQGSWSRNLRVASAERIERLAYRLDRCLVRFQEGADPDYDDDFRYARARAYCLYASEALYGGHTALGQQLIERSWAIYPWARLKQIVMYKSRHVLFFAVWIARARGMPL